MPEENTKCYKHPNTNIFAVHLDMKVPDNEVGMEQGTYRLTVSEPAGVENLVFRIQSCPRIP
jgi:hypothetical protein